MYDKNADNSIHDYVLCDRRRWDIFFIIILTTIGIPSAIVGYYLHFPKLCLVPLIMVIPWILGRYETPKEGKYVIRISKAPGLLLLLVFMATIVLMCLATFLISKAYNIEDKHSSIAMAVLLGFFLLGVFFIDSKYIRKKNRTE